MQNENFVTANELVHYVKEASKDVASVLKLVVPKNLATTIMQYCKNIMFKYIGIRKRVTFRQTFTMLENKIIEIHTFL